MADDDTNRRTMSPGEVVDAPTSPRIRTPFDSPKAPVKFSIPYDATRTSRDRYLPADAPTGPKPKASKKRSPSQDRPRSPRDRRRICSRSRSRSVSHSQRHRTGSLPRGLRSRYTPADSQASSSKMAERRRSRSRSRRHRTDSLPRRSYDSHSSLEADNYAPSLKIAGHYRARSRSRILSLRRQGSDMYTPADTNAPSSRMAERRRSRPRSRHLSQHRQTSPSRESCRHRTYSRTPSPPCEVDRRRSPRGQSPARQRRDKLRDRASPSRRRGRSRSQDRQSGETAREMPSQPAIDAPANRGRKSSGFSRKILSYDDLSEQRPKRNHEKMLEAFEVQDEVKKKMRLEKEAPKVNVLQHKPALSYDNQSEDGFMDLDTIIASQPLETAPVAATPTIVSGPSEVAGIHPDRIRRLSDDADMDVDMDADDHLTPAPEPFVPTSFNMMPLGSRKSRLETSTNTRHGPVSATPSQPLVPLLSEYISTPATIPAPTLVSASEELDTWGSNGETVPTASGLSAGAELNSWGTGKDDVPASSNLGAGEDFDTFGTGTGFDLEASGMDTTIVPAPSSFGAGSDLDSFGAASAVPSPSTGFRASGGLDSFDSTPAMAPAASSLGGGSDFVGSSSSVTMGPPPRVMALPLPRPAPIILDGRTRQEIFDDFCQEKDNIIYADSKRRKANGTIPYEVCDEEFALILSRLSIVPNKLALATIDFSAKPGESFLKHKGDAKFIVGGRLNDKGHAFTTLDEETTFQKINELGRGAIMRLVQTKPGSEKLVSRFERKAQSKVERIVNRTPSVLPGLPVVEEEKEKENGREVPIGLGIVIPSLSKQEDTETKALADIGIDVDMEL